MPAPALGNKLTLLVEGVVTSIWEATDNSPSTCMSPFTVVVDPGADISTATEFVDIGAPITTEDPPTVTTPVVLENTVWASPAELPTRSAFEA